MSTENEAYQKLLGTLLRADATSRDLHQLVLAASTLPGPAPARRNMIDSLLYLGEVEKGVLEVLVRHPDNWVRARAWAHQGLWTPAEVTAMVASERTSTVRAAALSHPGLDEDTYRRALGTMRYTAALSILEHCATLPTALVCDAVRSVGARLAPITDEATERIARALECPGVAYAVATDPHMNRWLVLAACAQPEVDADVVHAALSGCVLEHWADIMSGPGFHDHRLNRIVPLTRYALAEQFARRRDLSWEAAHVVVDLLGKMVGRFDPELASACSADSPTERGLLRWRAADQRNSSHCEAAWDAIPEAERSRELAELVLCHGNCDTTLLAKVAPLLGPVSEDDLFALLDEAPANLVPRWLVAYPRLAVRRLRGLDGDHVALRVREIAADADVLALLVSDMVAEPDQWAPGALATLSSRVLLPDAAVASLPAYALIAQVETFTNPAAAARLVEGLSALTETGRPDPAAVYDPTEVLAMLLTTPGEASIEDLVTAATAAYY